MQSLEALHRVGDRRALVQRVQTLCRRVEQSQRSVRHALRYGTERLLQRVEAGLSRHRRMLRVLHTLWVLGISVAIVALASDPGEARYAAGTLSPISGEAVDLESIDASIGEIQQAVLRAYFRAALEATDSLGGQLRASPRPDVRERRAKVDLLAATALVALRRTREAELRVSRALDAMPELELDPAYTPPKVLRLVRQARMTSPRGLHGAPSRARFSACASTPRVP